MFFVLFLLHLFDNIQKQQEMSYYQPFYYPYFSARAEIPPSLLHLDRRYEELRDIPTHAEVALAEQEARRIQIDNFARSHYARAQLDRMNQQRRIEAQVEAQLQLKRESEYLQRIAALRRERDLLNLARHPEASARERYQLQAKEKQQITRESYMTDQELLRHYATGQKYNEYQRDLKGRIAQQPLTKPNTIPAKAAYSHETQNSPGKIQKKWTAQALKKQEERHTPGKTQKQDETSRKERQRAAQAFKRSYIDELNDSKGNSIEKNSTYLKARGETIDLIPQSQLDMPFLQHRYGPAAKNGKKRRLNQSVSHNPKKKQNKNVSQLANTNRTFTAVTASEAMKKINNRLKVSAIVYKDSKLRNQRHEIDHLFNTFQIEIKGRKQVKDRINNNPDVMKKHNMVVQNK